MQTPIEIRLFTWDDLAALVALVNASAGVDQIDEMYIPESFREELTAHNDPTADCWLAVLPGGQLAGYAYIEWRDEDHARWGYGWGSVHPEHRRQGIGRQIMRHADAHFAEKVRASSDSKTAYIQRFLNSRNQGETALAVSEGYAPLRSSYRLSISLEQPLAPVPLPEGFELRPFDAARDAQIACEVDNEAFMDGGGQEQPMAYEDWYHAVIETRFDPALWLIAYASGEEKPIGIAYSQMFDETQPDLAWLSRLGVRRPWRGRGLGDALLRRSFYVCQQAGFKRLALGVRAEMDTALNLYLRAGMEIYTKYTHYRKMIV